MQQVVMFFKKSEEQSEATLEQFASSQRYRQNKLPKNFNSDIAQQAIYKLEQYSEDIKPICREKETATIRNFVIEGIKSEGCSQSLYIAGIPGIGKTLTVKSVIENLKEEQKYGSKFSAFYLNAMSYSRPQKIYKSILRQLFEEDTISKSKEISRLNYLFTTSSQTKVKVVVIDELDYLVTKDQSVLYNMFEWAQNPNSKLVLITISNTLDLPQKMCQKVYSRMGNIKIPFATYTREQIQRIVEKRLKQTVSIFSEQALRYACTKIVTTSCDMRKALFLLRQSLNVCILNCDAQVVQIDHVSTAFQNIFALKPWCEYIRLMPPNNQLVLIYVALDSSNESGKCLLFSVASRVHNAYQKISPKFVERIIQDLEQVGILKIHQQVINHSISPVVKMNVTNSQIRQSVQTEELQDLLNLIQQ